MINILKINETELKDGCKPLDGNGTKYFCLKGGDCLFICSIKKLLE